MTKHESWLWPDRTIGKLESRDLREEHNRLVNSHAELLSSLVRLNASPDLDFDKLIKETCKAIDDARAAIAKATN